MNDLKDKICVITGGTRGIGKAIALGFLAEGAMVYITGNKEQELPLWAKPYSEASRLEMLCFDVSKADRVRNAVLQIKRESGTIDVLINNAGIEFNELIAMNEVPHMLKMFEINVYGTILMTQYATKVMRQKHTCGSIVNISSGVGIYGNTGQSVYSATKGAVISFTKSAAKELAHDGIRVNSVAPGLVETEMLNAVNPSALKERTSRIPLGRLARPEEISDACVFLSSEKARYITGHVLSVDGCASL